VHIQTLTFPGREAFRDAESYYGTILHELVHATKHPSRLDRDLGRKSWGDAGYAAEELVAELGSAFLCADLEIALEPREENASYIATWLEVLKHDSRAIFTAASHAQRAADYFNRLQLPRREAAAWAASPRQPGWLTYRMGLCPLLYHYMLVSALLEWGATRPNIINTLSKE
jgi:antirestriction protein ArdC